MNYELKKNTMEDTKITGAVALIRSMLNEGVDTIFGYPGGAIMPVFDALYRDMPAYRVRSGSAW
jgi:thiamine pyrophosphate-dependent acetolactate synthase large subunit-like protein